MFKAIFWVAVLGILIFLTIKLLPAYIDNYGFQDELNNLARVVTYGAKTETDVRSEVLRMAKERGISLQPEQVTVQRTQVGVSIDVKYNVIIPVPGYTFNLKFSPSAGNKMITAQ